MDLLLLRAEGAKERPDLLGPEGRFRVIVDFFGCEFHTKYWKA